MGNKAAPARCQDSNNVELRVHCEKLGSGKSVGKLVCKQTEFLLIERKKELENRWIKGSLN